MAERAAPFYCPYCGDEDLRMFGETHGQWRCGACQRVFGLRYLGLASDWTTAVVPSPESPASSAAPAATEKGLKP